MAIRQPIVTLVGHVDHGKTTILDSIRKTAVAKKEAGGITQIISATLLPAEMLKASCAALLERFGIRLEIPGFLFIDTPGHAAFTNLRKRGGALADFAVLVIDINEGIMPQTLESIEILKANKVPFIVALNKIDAISGWRKLEEDTVTSILKQPAYIKKEFDEKLYRVVTALFDQDFNAEAFYRITRWAEQLAIVPCSAKTGEGIAELLVMLAGLSQRYLRDKLTFSPKRARGTILEVKRERGMLYLEAVLYDGALAVNNTIVIAGLEKPQIAKVRAIFEVLPLAKGFKAAKKVKAATGIRLQIPEAASVLPGMPFVSATQAELAQQSLALQKEVTNILKVDKEGLVIKADSLGSLEALMTLLRKAGMKIAKAGIGDINKADVAAAAASLATQPLNAAVLGFNVGIAEDVKGEKKVKLLTSDVIYKLIEDFEKWKEAKKLEIEREKLAGLVLPCRIKVLPYIFRKRKPAIFGVAVEAGTLKPGMPLMNSKGKAIDKIKGIQSKGKSIEQAKKGQEVAISLPAITIGRQVKEAEMLYSDINEEAFRKLKENKRLLREDEITLLQEIAKIKRAIKATWGL